MVTTVQYSLDVIKEEAARLVDQGIVSRQQPIYCLGRCFSGDEWCLVECELERNEYLLRDRIGDLLSQEKWDEDL